jgi:hypothetical protein
MAVDSPPEDTKVYIIIPRTVDSDKPPFKLNMTCGRMAAHAAHAAGLLTEVEGISIATETVIVLQVASSAEMEEIRLNLHKWNVAYLRYTDTDKAFDGELDTALITYPLTRSQAAPLKQLRPWKCACNEVPQRQSSSEKEHSLFKGGVGGSSPSSGSIPLPSDRMAICEDSQGSARDPGEPISPLPDPPLFIQDVTI